MQGIAVVKTFGQARRSNRQFVEHAHQFVDYFWEWVRGQIPWISAGNTVMSPIFAMVVIIAIGLSMVASGTMEAIDRLPFVILGPSLAAAFLTLSFAQSDLMLAQRAADRVAAVPDKPSLPESRRPPTPVGNRVSFEHVSFSYDGKNEAIREVNLTLEPDTITALVGASGSGKSTLAPTPCPILGSDRGPDPGRRCAPPRCCQRCALSQSRSGVTGRTVATHVDSRQHRARASRRFT